MEQKELTLDTINEILKKFYEQGVLFSNERQFQLELAFELKEIYKNVHLEVLDYLDSEKKYIDIVVDIGNNKLVAIELKYTTRDKNILYKTTNRNVYTFKQGAGDLRRFHYLKDVERLEGLLHKPNVFGMEGKEVIKGFAIIMTNDNYHSQDGKKYKNGKIIGDTDYFNVALNNGRTISVSEQPLTIRTSGYEGKKINLKHEYTCKWDVYELDQNETKLIIEGKESSMPYETYPFRYMILEIKP